MDEPLTFDRLANDRDDAGGDLPDWCRTQRQIVERLFLKERAEAPAYAGGRVLIDRRDHPRDARKPENRAAHELFHRRREGGDGCLTVGGERFWLLSFEVPSRGGDRGNRADLVGLAEDGGIVVFECKPDGNGTSPFRAAFQALHDPAGLTSDANADRVAREFRELRDAFGAIPTGFEGVEPRTGTGV